MFGCRKWLLFQIYIQLVIFHLGFRKKKVLGWSSVVTFSLAKIGMALVLHSHFYILNLFSLELLGVGIDGVGLILRLEGCQLFMNTCCDAFVCYSLGFVSIYRICLQNLLKGRQWWVWPFSPASLQSKFIMTKKN